MTKSTAGTKPSSISPTSTRSEKAYYEDQAGNSGSKSAASVKETTTGPRTTYNGRIAIPTGADSVNTMADTTAEYNEYVEGMEQSLDEVKEYSANIQTTTTTDTSMEDLNTKLLVQSKQTEDILTQNRKIMEAMMKMGAVVGAGLTEPETKNTATKAHLPGVQ